MNASPSTSRLVLGILVLALAAAALANVSLDDDGKAKITVELNHKPFTVYHYASTHNQWFNPILHPIIGPDELRMTRDYPLHKTPGEATDHPHHQGLWFNHGDVNGVSFWHIGKDTGRIVLDELLESKALERFARIRTRNKWVGPDERIHCTDERAITFSAGPRDSRVIDYEVTIHASQGDVTLGDTKEGTMGIRTHPNLRLTNGNGVTTANGKAINSEGVTGKDIWGKRARWVDYWGEIDGKTVGVAIFDHPHNPRHPTTWHAREYGLIAANPFGISSFEGKPKGAGDMKLKPGEKKTFRYRFIFHRGDHQQANIAEQYKLYEQAATIAD